MPIYSKDLKSFRKKHNIKLKDIERNVFLNSKRLYEIEDSVEIQDQDKADTLIRYYLKNIRDKAIRENANVSLRTSLLFLEKEQKVVLKEINELENRINELNARYNEIHNEISQLNKSIGEDRLSSPIKVQDDLKQDGYPIKGVGTSITTSYTFEPGFYTFHIDSIKDGASFEIYSEQVDDIKEKDHWRCFEHIKNFHFYVKERSVLCFYIFTAEDMEWEVKLLKLNGDLLCQVQENLEIDLSELEELEEDIVYQLKRNFIKTIGDLTSQTPKSIELSFGNDYKIQIENALNTSGLSLKQIQDEEYDDYSIDILNLSKRASNLLE